MRRDAWSWALSGFLVVLAALAPAGAWGQGVTGGPNDYVQPLGQQGDVNWMSGLITARGIGVASASAVNEGQRRAQALTAAEILARRNLLAVIKGVNLDSQSNVEGAMLGSDLVAQRITGFVQGAQVVDSKILPDGSAEVTVAIRAVGPLADLLLPPQRPKPPVPPVTLPSPPSPAPQPPAATPAPPKPEIYTGLVVDARGLNVRPALYPKLVSEGGQEIYGSAVVDRNWVLQYGMAGYSKDLFAAQSNDRVGQKPLVVKALRASGANKSDVVLSNDDAAKLLAAAENLSFLEKTRVMIVVD